jgi:3-isopropylmalate/(R)-2-methylmalate dehydratase small subunit
MKDSKRIIISGKAIPLKGNDIDTDQIMPARYLKEVTFSEMGEYLFYDARFKEDGSEIDQPFNDPRFKQGTVLVVGKNFGCGSSREHAPQAILRYGIKAIIGESFAEIFAGNCKALGIPLVTITRIQIEEIWNKIEANPIEEIQIDLEKKQINLSQETIPLNILEDWRQAFLTGNWDVLSLLKGNAEKIEAKNKELLPI